MQERATERLATAIFSLVVQWPKSVLVICLTVLLASTWFLPQLFKDTRSDAFLAADNPALIYRDKVKEQFGLSDPLVVAVVNEGAQGIFEPATLALVQWLTDEVSELPNVDSFRVLSLATENNIASSADGMEVVPFFDELPETAEQAAAMRAAVNEFPLYLGSLVSRDGMVTLVVAEMLDEAAAGESYQRLLQLVASAPKVEGVHIHVAGEGAIAGYLGSYIDADARQLNPIAGVVITLILILAYRRLAPALLCNVIILATVLLTLAAMAAARVPFFVITNALPVILIGIAVADAIHIYSHFFELQARQPARPRQELIVAALQEMWRPITFTTVTTAAGFLGLYFAAYMPPFKYFGLFAALGVVIAWFFSLVLLPAMMVLSKAQVKQEFINYYRAGTVDKLGGAMLAVARFTHARSRAIIWTFVLFCLLGLYAATQLVIDDDRIGIFDQAEPVYQADKIINLHMDGTNTLDIVVETPHMEDLFKPANLRRIEALQAFAQALPHVQGSTSIVDYLKQMNRALNGGSTSEYRLPDSEELVAQYFLIYSASADPTDFEEEVDYDYQTANVRINMNSGRYTDIKPVVEALETYLQQEFNSDAIWAVQSGRVTLNYHWIKNLGKSHFAGLALALLLVWAVSALIFGSVMAGLFALVPVAGSLLVIYTAMVVMGITLGVGTSMFAAVSIGLGVDFATHTLDRMQRLCLRYGGDMERIFNELYPTTGRALLFNFLAIACGFGVLIASKVVQLTNFGAIVVFSVSTSFVASMTVLPALIKEFQPAFILSGGPVRRGHSALFARLRLLAVVVFAGALLYALLPAVAQAVPAADQELPTVEHAAPVEHPQADPMVAEALTADQVVAQVNALDEGEFVTRKLSMRMIDRRGKERTRETISYRKYLDGEKRTVLFYLAPANVRDTAFLIWDYPELDRVDDQWLYLPALRKVRRISAADRGDYFLGTDFTYEDIKLDGKLEPKDYTFSLVGEEELDGRAVYVLEALPGSAEIAKELGYSRTLSWVDKSNFVVVKADFWNTREKHLKTLTAADVRQVDGIWTRHQLTLQNHATGHETRFMFSDVDYVTPVKDSLFSKGALARGH